MIKTKILKIVVALASFCSTLLSISNAKAITYGDPVLSASTQYPEVISLWTEDEIDGELGAICTATLIEQQIAVTAAHCVRGNEGNLWAEVGTDRLGEGRLIRISGEWYHSRYSEQRFANDIGVVVLAESANVPRLASLKRDFTVNTKSRLEIAGWGINQNGDELVELNRLSVRFDTAGARAAFGSAFNPKTTIAAGKYFRAERVYGGACNGDSGGPLYLGVGKGRPQLIGITSYGLKGCDETAPTVYASMRYYFTMMQQGIDLARTRAAQNQAQISATPLVASITINKPYQYLNYWDVNVTASTHQSGHIAEWCFFVDGRISLSTQVSYGSGEMPFSSDTDGCFRRDSYLIDKLTSGSVQFKFDSLAAGPHSLYAVVKDTLGRVVTTSTLSFTK